MLLKEVIRYHKKRDYAIKFLDVVPNEEKKLEKRKLKFVEMFGNPAGNLKGWTMVPLGIRCGIITGNTPSRAEAINYVEFIE